MRSDYLICVAYDSEVGVVGHSYDLPSTSRSFERTDQVRRYRLIVEVLLRLVDDQRRLIGINE